MLPSSFRRLRLALVSNALFSGLSAVGCLAWPGLSTAIGVPEEILAGLGIDLAVFAVLLLLVATRSQLDRGWPRLAVAAIIGADLAWVLATAVLLAVPSPLTVTGRWSALAVAVVVADLALFQWSGWRRGISGVASARIAATALVGLLLLSGADLSAAPAPDPAVDAYLAAYRAGDPDRLLAIYADDAVFEDVARRERVEGRDALGEMLERLVGLHVAMDLEVKRRVVEGARVVLEVDYLGTLDCAAVGLPGERLDYRLPAVLFFEVADGRIERQTDYLEFRTLAEIQARVQAKLEAAPES